MTVPTMTPVEIYNEINKDVPKLLRFEARTIHEFGRPAMKSSKYPFVRDYVYTSRETGLEYHYRYICWAHKFWKNPWYFAYIRYSHEGGTTVVRLHTYIDRPLLINIYTPHFFQRYNERVLKDTSATSVEVIQTFLHNNITDLDVDEEDGPVIRHSEMYFQDDDANYFAAIALEGMMICESRKDEPNIVISNTFVSLNMLVQEQRLNAMHSIWALRNSQIRRLHPTIGRSVDETFMSIMRRSDAEGWSQEQLYEVVEEWYRLLDLN